MASRRSPRRARGSSPAARSISATSGSVWCSSVPVLRPDAPAPRLACSKSVTRVPRRASSHATEVPAMPPPTTTTSVPVISIVFRIWNDRATSGTPSPPTSGRCARSAGSRSASWRRERHGQGDALADRGRPGQPHRGDAVRARRRAGRAVRRADRGPGRGRAARPRGRPPAVGGGVEARVLTQVPGGALVEALEITSPPARSARRSRTRRAWWSTSSSRAGGCARDPQARRWRWRRATCCASPPTSRTSTRPSTASPPARCC